MTSLIKTTLKVFSVVKKTWELDIIILDLLGVKNYFLILFDFWILLQNKKHYFTKKNFKFRLGSEVVENTRISSTSTW